MKHLTTRQQEIVDAALDIIAAQGIQRMTVKNLARALHVSEPALYRHFSSKYGILLAILVNYRKDLSEMFDQSTGSDKPSVEKIGSLYGDMFRSFVGRPALSMVIFSEDLFRFDRRLSQEVFEIIEITHDRICGILREGVRDGQIRSDVPIKQLAWMVMGTMRLLITKWRISGYALDLLKEGRQLLVFMRRVLKA